MVIRYLVYSVLFVLELLGQRSYTESLAVGDSGLAWLALSTGSTPGLPFILGRDNRKHRHVHCYDLKITVKKHTRLILFRGCLRDTMVTGQAIKRSYRNQEAFEAESRRIWRLRTTRCNIEARCVSFGMIEAQNFEISERSGRRLRVGARAHHTTER